MIKPPFPKRDGLKIIKADAMRGYREGLKQQDKPEIYVAPEIYSLLHSDFDATINALHVRVVPAGSLDIVRPSPRETMAELFSVAR